MSSHCASSDIEGSPSVHASPAEPSWWSDSDGRRSHRLSPNEESPWWESDGETEIQRECKKDSPIPSPGYSGYNTSPLSLTPTWWSDPSSRQISSSAAEDEVDPSAEGRLECHIGEGGGENCVKDGARKSSMSVKSRKRMRAQLSNMQNEPPVNKIKLDPPSPLTEPTTVVEDIRKGIFAPLQRFLLFFTVDLLTKICDLTNAHAWESILSSSTFANEDGSWEEVTVKEMHVFIAIVLIMRRHRDVGFGSFWREARDGHWPRTLMKRSRFFAILQLLTLADPVKKDSRSKSSCMQDCIPAEGQVSGDQKLQFSRVTDISDVSRFQYLFNQIKTALEAFLQSYEVQFLEKISTRVGSTDQDESLNYMKIISSSHKQSKENKGEPCTTELNSESKPECSEHKIRTVKNSDGSKENDLQPNNLFMSVNGQEYTDVFPAKQDLEKHERLASPPDSRLNMQTNNPEIYNNDKSKCLPHLNMISLKWHDNSLNITVDRERSRDLAFHQSPDDASAEWQNVFIPCPEVVYKDLSDTQDGSDNFSGWNSGPSDPILAKSIFYHYLNLALYFSTTTTIQGLASGCRVQNEGLLDDQLQNLLIEGLVSLGDPDPISQSDSDSEMRESDVSCDTSSDQTEEPQSGDESDGGGKKPHKYVQARSRIGQKCALCWSLHKEVRKVHTRCSRCGKHFCLSRFQNCMEEAHGDAEKMQQILSDETLK